MHLNYEIISFLHTLQGKLALRPWLSRVQALVSSLTHTVHDVDKDAPDTHIPHVTSELPWWPSSARVIHTLVMSSLIPMPVLPLPLTFFHSRLVFVSSSYKSPVMNTPCAKLGSVKARLVSVCLSHTSAACSLYTQPVSMTSLQ